MCGLPCQDLKTQKHSALYELPTISNGIIAWFDRSPNHRKYAANFPAIQDHCWEIISGNELLKVPSTLEAVATWTLPPLTTDINIRTLELLKGLIFAATVLAKRKNIL